MLGSTVFYTPDPVELAVLGALVAGSIPAERTTQVRTVARGAGPRRPAPR